MPDEVYSTGTVYRRNAVTMKVGTPADIATVGVYLTTDPAEIPAIGDFTAVQLVDGTASPPDAGSEAGVVDVLYRIGARTDADFHPEPGDYQRWVLISTAEEDVISPVDTVTVK